MLITNIVEIKWSNSNKKWYINKGYLFTRNGDKFVVSVEDLPQSCAVKVEVLCDYCNENRSMKPFYTYNTQRNKTISKDCCKKCVPMKQREVCLVMHGVEHNSKINKVAEKIAAKQRHLYDYIKSEFEKRGYSLLSDKYENNETHLLYLCNRHKDKGTQQMCYTNLQAGHGCKWCGVEKSSNKRRNTIEYARQVFESKNCELLEDEYKNNTKKMKYRCLLHPEIIQHIALSNFKYQIGCKFCYLESISGSNNSRWTGTRSLSTYLRKQIDKWKLDSMKACGYRCVVTGRNNDLEIHHLTSFHIILSKTLKRLDIPLFPNISSYSNEDLRMISEECLKIHYEFGMGVVLTKEIHQDFHNEYGRTSNTPEQFNEYIHKCHKNRKVS